MRCERHRKPPFLRFLFLEGIHTRFRLQDAREAVSDLPRQGDELFQDAFLTQPNSEFRFGRFEVEIRGLPLEGAEENFLDHRLGGGNPSRTEHLPYLVLREPADVKLFEGDFTRNFLYV